MPNEPSEGFAKFRKIWPEHLLFCFFIINQQPEKKLTRINNFLWKLTLSWQKKPIQLSFTEEFKTQKPLEELSITYNFNHLCNFSHLKYTVWITIQDFCRFLLSV